MDFINTPPQFIFPVLKSADILQCMSELDIELSKAELSEPQRHREKLRKVFLKLLETCCGTMESDLEPSKVALEKAASMPHADLHDVSRDIKLFRLLRKILYTSGIYDFSWKDLIAPTSKRLRWQLSAIINLAKFREDQLLVYADLNEPRGEFLLTLEDVNREHDHLKIQLSQVQTQSDEDYQALEEVAKQCKNLTSQIAHSNKLQASKREEASTLKRQANDLKDELATATWALEEVVADEEGLRCQVVSSPDRRLIELKTNREALDRERDECDIVEMEFHKTKTICRHIGEAKNALVAEMVAAYAVKEGAGKYSDVAKEVETMARGVESVKKQGAQVTGAMGLCKRELNRTQEYVSTSRVQCTTKMEAAKQTLEKTKNLMQTVEQDHRDGMKRVETGELKVRELEAQIEEERLQGQREVEAMTVEFRETEALVIARLSRRIEAMEANTNC